MSKKLLFFVTIGCFVFSQNIWAQERTVSGTITDADSDMPLLGVNVVEKGTKNGTSSDFDGKYSIDVAEGAVLEFSIVGFATKEITVGSESKIDVQMSEDTQALEKVVVTALGIKRKEKSLGYSLQEVKGDELEKTQETNVANALTGKVAGLNVIRGSGGPASSSKIVLRGNNSLTGNNQPLIVVDGVPMDNFTGASNNDFYNPSTDMGNGLGDLNPENIESMSVLKGASAAALYGSRAGDGVILITTKSGTKQDGLGITYSAKLGLETIFKGPQKQSLFGQGSRKVYDKESGLSWGPKIEGQTVTNWNDKDVPLRAYDNVDNYFDTGVSFNQSLSFSQKFENTSLYSSVSHLDDDSNIPGSDLKRTNILTKATSNFGPDKRWTTNVKVQYINLEANNRPFSGVNESNAFNTLYLMPRSVDITDFSAATNEFGKQIWYKPGSNEVNPYWGAQYDQNKDSRDRFLLNGSVKYQFTDWLQGEIKAGSDMYTTNTEKKVYGGSPLTPTGRYSMGKRTFSENNYSGLFSASKDDLFGEFGLAGSLGGNLMYRKSSKIEGNAGELEVPDLFSINNGIDNPTVSEERSDYRINSLYGTFQVNYGGYVFLDFSGRNDWSSSLSKENRSFFYPSVSASVLLNDVIEKNGGNAPSWLTFTKIRGSYAEVGNDLDPYQLYNTYSIGKDPNGGTIASKRKTLFNPNVQSELIKSWEAGLDIRFIRNRIGLDISWYKTNATNQLINIPLNPLSGYFSRKVNAGDIENQGIEIMLNAKIFNAPDGFSWNTTFNFSKNKNKINRLVEGVDKYKLGGFDNLSIVAKAGSDYGDIYGTKFERVEDKDSKYYGERIVDGDGEPVGTNETFLLGNQQPDALLGWMNNFSWKGIDLSFQIDARFGGEIFSGTNAAMELAGTSNKTLVNGAREDFVVDGVVDASAEDATEKTYQANTTTVSHQNYWEAVAGVDNIGIGEANIYDATNIRLRTINLSYNLPKEWIEGLALQRAKIGFTANNVWMIDSHMNGIDPESIFATGTNATGFENLSTPTMRSYFFNVTLSF